MTKLNEKRTEMAYDYAGLSPEDTPASFNMTCFAEKAAFNCGWNSALAEVMPMMREMAEKSRSLGHAVVMGQKEDIIFATKELSDVLNKYNELVGK